MNQKRKREGSSSCFSSVKRQKIKEDYSGKRACISAENKNKMKLSNSPEKDENLSLSKNILKISFKTSLKETIGINLSTIEEIHKLAKIKFNEIKNDKELSYQKILDEVIHIYDLDEDINSFFLEKLNEYYRNKKNEIGESTDGESDSISKLFFNFIFSIKFEKRKKIFLDFQYFGKNEIFTEKDKKFFYNVSIDAIFRNFAKDLCELSDTIKSPKTEMSSEEYIAKLDEIFEKYPFPDFSFKIPIKFGNIELIYINLIVKLHSFFCPLKENSNNCFQKQFNKYEITTKFLAFNFFQDYFNLKEYDIFSLQYIVFCLYTFFVYYEGHEYTIKPTIKEEIFACSRFLYQKFEEKKEYLKEIKEYIKDDIDFDKVDENYLNNNLLIIQYNGKEVKINANHCYILGNKKEYLNDLINGNAYNFEYLRTKKFPLFLDEALNKDFISYVKTFLKSNINKEYFNNLNEIESISEHFFTDKIIDEINNNSIWVKFPLNGVKGITERDTFTVFLNNYIKKDKKEFSNVLSSKVITCGHENNNHVIRLLIHINNYKISKTTPRNKNLYKDLSFNDAVSLYNNQGDMWEHILFGIKISKIYLMGSLYFLDSKNFNLTINEFKKHFMENNRRFFELKPINDKIRTIKENENNTLSKYINEFTDEEFSKDEWLKDEQFIIARNNSETTYGNCQFIECGICGTHAFD